MYTRCRAPGSRGSSIVYLPLYRSYLYRGALLVVEEAAMPQELLLAQLVLRNLVRVRGRVRVRVGVRARQGSGSAQG